MHLLHPSLLKVVRIFPAGDSYILVSEFMEVTLKEVIAAPIVPSETQIAYISRHILRAVSFLHTQGLIHGRLDPQQVFLRKDGSVKLCKL